ncbi:hypothetical protein PFISCL1PPCAC_27143, partial [Pristionchus fissidentatus]
ERLHLLSASSSQESLLSTASSYGGMPEVAAHHATVASGEDTLKIYGYRTSKPRTILYWTLSILTLGVFRLLLHWVDSLYIRIRSTPCTLDQADLILVIDDHDVHTIRPVKETKAENGDYLVLPNERGDEMSKVDQYKWFTFRKMTYVWFEHECRFITPADIDSTVKVTVLQNSENKMGLSTAEVARRMRTYGSNLIAVKLKPLYVLFFTEAITPFYVFQVFSVIIWYTDQYAYYATVIVIMSLSSLFTDMYQMRQQEKKLRAMIHSVNEVEVLRDGKIQVISSEDLVVGDTLLIPRHGCTLQCDAVLQNGTVIVNEAMLTGESVPITKVALTGIDEDNSDGEVRFDIDRHSKHVLFCGTNILQTRFYEGQHVKATVIRTAYSTLKGQLVRSIMYPKPVDFRFTRDLFRFVLFLACIAFCGFIYTIIIMALRGNDISKIIIRSLDIVTITVPPALPAAMSVGIINSKMRLSRKNIYCISPSTINTCGAVNVCCFDKTGTLTEDGLDFLTMLGVRSSVSRNVMKFTKELKTMNPIGMPFNGELVKAIATCHSLTRIDGKLNGDPLDLILFNQTKWTIEEGNDSASEQSETETGLFDAVQPSILRPPHGHNYDATEYSILRQFTFSSSLQRMSVIVGTPESDDGSLVLYSKGSPEMIASLCKPETVPANYNDVVNDYAQHGYRLIAVARKKLDMGYAKAAKIARGQVEVDLELLGLVVLENRVKPETLGSINQLTRARIRTVMVTGDNLLTALSVARECGIIRPNKKAFLIEAKMDEKDEKGRTRLTIKQSVSSHTDRIIEEDHFVMNENEANRLLDSSYHLAISGPTFAVITHEYPELLHKLVCVCDVFARMAPDQKKQLVNTLQDVEYTVLFCGDGANDCAALKAAHAGISLSEAEASIAAPFTSQTANISCVPEVIREGRAALVTSFGIFKYMSGYSLCQFVCIMQLYWISTNLTDMMFLYIDLVLITFVAVFFGNTPACEHLSATPPPTRLLTLGSVFSILGQLLIMATSQLIVFIHTSYQPWFSPYTIPIGDDDEDKKSMQVFQGTAIFGVSVFQYIALAVIYSKGAPYRQTIFHNKPLVLLISFLALVNLWIVLAPPVWVINFLEYVELPYFEYRLFIVMVSVISIFLMFGFETIVVDALLHDKREKVGENFRSRKRDLMKKMIPRSHSNMMEAVREYSEDEDRTSLYGRVTGMFSWLRNKKLRGDSNAGQKFERTLVAVGSEPIWIRSVARYVPADPMRPNASSLSLKKQNGVAVVDEVNQVDDDASSIEEYAPQMSP